MKVCEKVQRKGVTTYNEVADELVAEFSSGDNHISPNDAVSLFLWPDIDPQLCLLSAEEVQLFKPIKELLFQIHPIMNSASLSMFVLLSMCMTRRTFDGVCTMRSMC